ncbi:NAD-dependent epimerase/dehydratase family protein [Riemerella anatipestifer]|uniref:NAD-dependent epimerase/dehydratase family protein n=1 Tax=Riemerella anatipestifer TaxID=34085 RepID=UPI002096E2DC|nr:NAD-dependent epimerase/dehydratase family protein [Riemerella anatipestifer]MCO7355472.1 NAD-dependent epimerase/dehydratase family protein [Riemerella anatipestifer]
MVVGKGLVASLFTNVDREDIIFFASGVSNSLEVRMEEFMREENLVRETIANHPDKVMVYFSTCSIYDSSKVDSPYVRHKLKMENIVSNNCSRYLILRLSNVVGKGGNPNLLMNYLVNSVKRGEVINVHTKATRNLIDAEDVKAVVFNLLKQKQLNRVVNLAYIDNYTIIEILEILESAIKLKPNLNLIKAGAGYPISISSEVENYFVENSLNNKHLYLKNILSKYYLS